MTASIQFDIDARGVATITLDRPERRNAFDDGMIAALHTAFEDVARAAAVRALVLRGAGAAFCAGADLAWMRRMAGFGEAENLADSRRLAAMLQRLNTLPVPTVAIVQGAAYGGGAGLLCCCDIVLAAETAAFRFSEVLLGLTPATIGPYVLAAIGARNARRYFLTAEVIDAARAVQIGLVHEAMPAAKLEERAEDVIDAILGGKPVAQTAAKALIAELHYTRVDAAVSEQMSQRIAERRAHPEAQAALAAFLGAR